MNGDDLQRAGSDLRVLVITTSTKPWENEIWAAAASHVADVLLVAGEDGKGELGASGLDVEVLSQVDLGRGLLYRHLRGLRRLIKRYQPDLIHVNGEAWSITALEVAFGGFPYVVHGAENIWEHGSVLERAARRRLAAYVLAGARGYASWNAAGAAHVSRSRRFTGVIGVFPAIVPSEIFWSQRRAEASSPRRIVVAGRLIPEKGIDTVLHAARELLDEFAVEVDVFGDGPLLPRLTELASELHVPVVFHGSVSPQDLAHGIARAFAVVQASIPTADWDEQFGRTVAEAMAVGAPVIASRTGALPEVTQGPDWSLFSPGCPSDLARAIRRLNDHSSRLSLANTQQAAADRYALSLLGSVVADFWQSAAAMR